MFGNNPSGDLELINRRHYLSHATAGLTGLALGVYADDAKADESTRDSDDKGSLSAKAPHFPARAKSVIYLSMSGGPVSSNLCAVELQSISLALLLRNL